MSQRAAITGQFCDTPLTWQGEFRWTSDAALFYGVEGHRRYGQIRPKKLGEIGGDLAREQRFQWLSVFLLSLTQGLFQQLEHDPVLGSIGSFLLPNQFVQIEDTKRPDCHRDLGRMLHQIFVAILVADKPQHVQRSGASQKQKMPTRQDVFLRGLDCRLMFPIACVEFVKGMRKAVGVLENLSKAGFHWSDAPQGRS